MAAVPQIGRATRVERPVAPGVDAAGDLYERYSAQILGYCLHQLGSREEAEDAVQTTFMNAFRGLQRGIVPELESAWLFKIAHNVCLSRHRSSWRRGKVESPNNLEVLQDVVAGPRQAADELIRLQDVLEDMPENQRRAILLREWQGLTYQRDLDRAWPDPGRRRDADLPRTTRARSGPGARRGHVEETAAPRRRRRWRIRLREALLGGGGAAAVKITATALAVASMAAAAATTEGPKHDAYQLSLGKQPAPMTIHVTRAAAPRTEALTSTTPAHHRDTNREVRELRGAEPAEACLAAHLASHRGDSRPGIRRVLGADSHARAWTDRADACASCSDDRRACPGATVR